MSALHLARLVQATSRRPASVSDAEVACRSMKAEHLKAQADECVRQGNYGVAAQR
jgi:hypothetical protein